MAFYFTLPLCELTAPFWFHSSDHTLYDPKRNSSTSHYCIAVVCYFEGCFSDSPLCGMKEKDLGPGSSWDFLPGFPTEIIIHTHTLWVMCAFKTILLIYDCVNLFILYLIWKVIFPVHDIIALVTTLEHKNLYNSYSGGGADMVPKLEH